MIFSLQKLISDCGDSKQKWNYINEEKPIEISKNMFNSPTSFDNNDIFKHSFFNTFLNEANNVMNKKKIIKKIGSYRKKRTAKYDLRKENLDVDVDGLLSSALGRRLEVGDELEDMDDYSDIVLNGKNKTRKRNQLTKKKEKNLKISPHRKNKKSSKQSSHIVHSHPNKVKSLKENVKHVTKSSEPEDQKTFETNFMTLMNLSDSPLIELSNNVTKSSSRIYENIDYTVKSHQKPEKRQPLDNSRNIKCEFDSEHDIVQHIEHRVFDRLLISALGNINKDGEIKDNNNLYTNQRVSKEKMKEQETYSPGNKFNNDHLIDISKPITKMPPLICSNKISPKCKSPIVGFSDTKVEKAKTKTKKEKKNAQKRRKNFSSNYKITVDGKQRGVDRLIVSALLEGVVDHNSDEYNVDHNQVYDENVNSHNVHDNNTKDTNVLINLLLSNLSPFVESISNPKFIYDKTTHDSDTTIEVKDDKKCATQTCDLITDGRHVESVRKTEQGTCFK